MSLYENTLLELVENLVRVPLKDLKASGTCTGGSTTTIVDTVKLKEFGDDYFQNLSPVARVLITSTTDGAAPIGEHREASDHVQSTGTTTVSVDFSASPASGDKYIIFSNYDWDEMVAAINMAIDDATSKGARIEKTDESSVILQDDTYEYLVPTGFTEIYRMSMDDGNGDFPDPVPPDQYKIIRGAAIPRIHFYRFPTDMQYQDHYYSQLWVETDLTDGRVLRLEGYQKQPHLENPQDICRVNPNYIIWKAAEFLFSSRVTSVDYDQARAKRDMARDNAREYLSETRTRFAPDTKKVQI